MKRALWRPPSVRLARRYQPFRLEPALQDLFRHASWIAAERAAHAAMAASGRLLLIGAAGTGKTALLQRLRADGVGARLLRPCDVHEVVAGVEVLLVDEACTVSDAALERLCRLPNGLVLAGLPRLLERVAHTIGPSGSATLEPLTTEEVTRFIASRLAAAKRPVTMFSPDAALAVAQHAAGLLRHTILLAGAALYFAELRGARQVELDDVGEAACMRAIAPAATGTASPAETLR